MRETSRGTTTAAVTASEDGANVTVLGGNREQPIRHFVHRPQGGRTGLVIATVAKSMSRRRIVTMGAAGMAGAALPLVPGTANR